MSKGKRAEQQAIPPRIDERERESASTREQADSNTRLWEAGAFKMKAT